MELLLRDSRVAVHKAGEKLLAISTWIASGTICEEKANIEEKFRDLLEFLDFSLLPRSLTIYITIVNKEIHLPKSCR